MKCFTIKSFFMIFFFYNSQFKKKIQSKNLGCNYINTWLVNEGCDQDETADDLDDLCEELDEKDEHDSDRNEQFMLKMELLKILMTGKNNHY